MLRATDENADPEQQHRLQSVLSVVSEGIIIRDREGGFVSCGEATPALLGLTRAEMSAATSPAGWDLLDGDGRSARHQLLAGHETLRSGGAHGPVTAQVVLPDGSHRWLEIRTAVVRRQDGGLSGVTIALRDVTEVRDLRDVSLMNEARIEALLEDTVEGAFEMDLVKGRTARSLRVFQILGLEPVELSDRVEDWYRLIHEEDLPHVKAAWLEVLSGRAASFELEYRMRHAEGRWLWVQARAQATRVNPRGIPLWMTGSITDVTRRREAEDALASARAELARLARR